MQAVEARDAGSSGPEDPEVVRNHELSDMQRRFWLSLAFGVPLVLLGMAQ
jgi:hypothetical protein